MPFGWNGQKTRLVPLEMDQHFNNVVRWLNDPDVTWRLLIGDFPLTRLAEEEFFNRIARDTTTDIVFAIETLSEPPEHIGTIGFHQVDYRHGSATLGLFIGRKPLWGRGFGTDAIAIATRYAFEVAGLRLIISEAMSDNFGSIAALQKNNYRHAGGIPQRHWKRGAYRDTLTYFHTAEAWRTGQMPPACPPPSQTESKTP